MGTFLLILGVILFVGSFLLFFLSEGDSGTLGMIIGIAFMVFGFTDKYLVPKGKETPKAEKTEIDSTQVQVLPDSIGEIQFVISYKDEQGVWAGNNVRLKGRTEKNIGDTITIKLPN